MTCRNYIDVAVTQPYATTASGICVSGVVQNIKFGSQEWERQTTDIHITSLQLLGTIVPSRNTGTYSRGNITRTLLVYDRTPSLGFSLDMLFTESWGCIHSLCFLHPHASTRFNILHDEKHSMPGYLQSTTSVTGSLQLIDHTQNTELITYYSNSNEVQQGQLWLITLGIPDSGDTTTGYTSTLSCNIRLCFGRCPSSAPP